MIRALGRKRFGPIGVDIGSRSIKLMQLTVDGLSVVDLSRSDLPTSDPIGDAEQVEQAEQQTVEAVRRARQSRNFHGREVVLCLGEKELFVQNIRVPKASGKELEQIVLYEAEGRIPFEAQDAEIRYVEAADVRQGDLPKREVILLASPRSTINRMIGLAEQAGLRPVAIDAEPIALLRCYAHQFRRDDDKHQRNMFVHVGATKTVVVIAQGDVAMFIKYVDVGGQHFDEAVAENLKLPLADAATLRRHVADRADDPELAQSVTESLRGVVQRLADELSLCMRYYSVAFRGQPLSRMVLGGGDADQTLGAALQNRLDISCDIGNPFRAIKSTCRVGRSAQWAIAAGLALRL